MITAVRFHYSLYLSISLSSTWVCGYKKHITCTPVADALPPEDADGPAVPRSPASSDLGVVFTLGGLPSGGFILRGCGPAVC